MRSQDYDPYSEKIRGVVNRFCSRHSTSLQVIAEDLRVRGETFYKIVQGRQSWPQGLAVRVYGYMKSIDPLQGERFIQAFFADEAVGARANGELVAEIALELNAEVFRTLQEGIDGRRIGVIERRCERLVKALKKAAEGEK